MGSQHDPPDGRSEAQDVRADPKLDFKMAHIFAKIHDFKQPEQSEQFDHFGELIVGPSRTALSLVVVRRVAVGHGTKGPDRNARKHIE